MIFFLILYGLILFLPWFINVKTNPIIEVEEISIVIPYRNEVKGLNKFLNSLQVALEQIPEIKKEIILVDDNSDDGSTELINRHLITKSYLIKTIPNQGEGKKEALRSGLSIASSKFIIQFDADVEIEKNTIKEHILKLECGSVYNSGVVKLNCQGNFPLDLFQRIENIALMGLTENTFKLKMPLMSNGANSSYILNDGFQLKENSFASGDDIFTLYSLKGKTKSISFVREKVSTEGVSSWKELFQQRLRWISKGNGVKNVGYRLINLVILICHLLVPFAFLWMDLNAYLKLILIKLLMDWVFVGGSNTLTKYNWSILLFFPFVYIFYPFYLFMLILCVPFVKVKWKGRRIK